MKKQTKAKTCILLSMLLMLMGVSPVMAEEAEPAQPKTALEGGIYGVVEIDENNSEEIGAYFSMEDGLTFDDRVEDREKISYDKATNTLSLTDFDYPEWYMEIDNTGSDFKINLTGKNTLRNIYIYARGEACSVEFTGTGTLELNKEKNKKLRKALSFSVYDDAVLTFGVSESVTLKAYAAEGMKSVDGQRIKDGGIKIVGDCSSQLTKEPYSYPNTIDMVAISEETLSGNSYSKEGDADGIYVFQGKKSRYMPYKLASVKYPDTDKEFYIGLRVGKKYVTEIPNEYTSTGKTVNYNVCSTMDYEIYEKDGKKYVVDELKDADGEYAVYTCAFEKIENFPDLAGLFEDAEYYRSSKVEKIESLTDSVLKEHGYEKEIIFEEGYINLYSNDAEWTLTPSAHTHTGTAVAPTVATCTADGSKAYYICSCGKVFEDADCIKEIQNLASWKVVKAAGHNFGTNNETCSKCGKKNPDYKASEPEKITTPTTASDGNKVTTTAKGEAAVTEVEKTNKTSITVPSTTIVNGVTYKITTINANTFKNASNATTVTLPDTIKKINANAFANSKVKTVKLTVGKGASLSINRKAFKNSKVKKVQITISKKTTEKQKNKLIKALKKAGIKNITFKLKK